MSAQSIDDIRSEVIGSLLRPAYLKEAVQRFQAGQIAAEQLTEVQDRAVPAMQVFTPGGMEEMSVNLREMLPNLFGGRKQTRRVRVAEARELLRREEAQRLVDNESVASQAIERVEQDGIVFVDELDKIAGRESQGRGPDISREGVQRDLLPLIEGTTVSTKYGPVKSDHVLFIASGAFHVAKPSDLLPELQGRLPIRVELKALTRDDFRRILTEPESNLIRQNQALLATEDVTLEFTDDAVDALADAAVAANSAVENIGARRLQTVMEKLVEEVSFTASDRNGEHITIDRAVVRRQVGELVANADLSKFIL